MKHKLLTFLQGIVLILWFIEIIIRLALWLLTWTMWANIWMNMWFGKLYHYVYDINNPSGIPFSRLFDNLDKNN